MSTATSGRAREYRVRDDMVSHGWHLVARSAGSKGVADLVMVHPDHGLALVQVGTPKKALGPAERVRFIRLAELCSALPILATPIPGVGIRYRQAGVLGPMSWEEWKP